MTTVDVANPYHPDPLGTGSARVDDSPCVVCGRSDTAKYEGEAHFHGYTAVDEEDLCIACINDGTAHERLGATFTDHFSTGDGWDDVPLPVIDTIRARTPAAFTWQTPRWLACCGDACVYRGVVDEMTAQAAAAGSDVPASLLGPAGNAAPSWYLFTCTQCGAHLVFSDAP